MSDIIVNKVIKGDETYLDLTSDTVTEGTLLKNRTAHNSEGVQILGAMEEGGGSVTGVKGDEESTYRDGDVNLTAANIGTYTASQIDARLNGKVDVHGSDSLMSNAERVKLAGIEAEAEKNVIESVTLNGSQVIPVDKTIALDVIDKDVDNLTNYYKKSESDALLSTKQNRVLASTLNIGGQTITEVEPALHALNNKSGTGGHTILDEDGVTYPQRSKLQFEGCEVTDDSTNDITKIRLMANNAGAHNGIYRGKYLGNALTSAQKAAIEAGTFEDLYIGDYWTIRGVNWRIAAFDYWLHCGDTECITHHVVIVPDTNLYSAKMNDSRITTGGYVGSKMYTDSLATAKTTIKNAFGSANILSYREYLVNAVANGKPSAGAWYDSDIELMNERMVYGCPVFEPACDGSTVPTLYTIDKSQLPLFALDPSRITNRANWWLRDVVSAAHFAFVVNGGHANHDSASVSLGVRPAFAIC